MIDFQSLLFNPKYNAFGVEADLVSSGGVEATVTVIDETSGVAVGDGVIDSIAPVARVRMKELTDNEIPTTDLKGGNLTFNGATWRIKSHKVTATLNGESDGEVKLILLDEG